MSNTLPLYVRVSPELAVHKQFDYAIPELLRGKIRRGHRLLVPWGEKKIFAYAVDFPREPEVKKIREVIEIVGDEPLIPFSLFELAAWIADYYGCDFSLALKNMLPETVRGRADAHKMQFWVSVPTHLEEEKVLATLGKAKAQKKAWLLAKERGGGWVSELSNEISTTHAVWRALADRGYVELLREKMERNPLTSLVGASKPHDLNPSQAEALKAIVESLDTESPAPFLLQGVTGSGKTEIYLRVLDEVLQQGKSALILVPEIALTPQTVNQFRARFEGKQIRVAVLHSHLSAGERHDQWQQIRSGAARVVIGARSAIFAPMQKLGVLIVDEEHESSYKQEEAPHYHARDVAIVRGKIEKVPVVLGSATPSLESFYNVDLKKYKLLRLPERIDSKEMPTIHIVDLRKEKAKAPIGLSDRLREAIEWRLAKGEQSILFLNRRGYATMLQCPNCGHVEECPHCAVSLTYHRTNRTLRCHMCNYQKAVPDHCPECQFENYKYSGMGTQKIEDAVQAAFPSARWQRMDSDSMRGKHAYETVLNDFREGKIDLLIGTQMIAKGLHFPNVTCVGIINIDYALQLPDFRAAERVFQQLVQVSGRAGRGNVPGEVYLQTYTPFHSSIQYARHHDVDGFLEQELEYRRAHQYPPFSRAALITFRGASEAKTQFCIEQAAKKIRTQISSGTEIPEPAPAPIAKIQDQYRFHLFICTKKIMELSRILKKEVTDVNWPEGVKASVNIDPVNLL